VLFSNLNFQIANTHLADSTPIFGSHQHGGFDGNTPVGPALIETRLPEKAVKAVSAKNRFRREISRANLT